MKKCYFVDSASNFLTLSMLHFSKIGPLTISAALSTLTAATATNTIDNLNFDQTWNWSTASTQTAQKLTGNALTTGSLLELSSSNASVNSTNGLLNVANTGTSQNGVLARFQANSTAGSGLTVRTSGRVGIGTATPSYPLELITSSAITSGMAIGQNNNLTYSPTAIATGVDIVGSRSNLQHTSSFNVGNLFGSLSSISNTSSTMASGAVFVVGQGATASTAGSGATTSLSAFYGSTTFTGNGSGNAYGVLSSTTLSGAATINTLSGANFTATTSNASATVLNGYGVRAQLTNTNATISSAYGLYSTVTKTSGTNTSAYGVYIGNVQGTTIYSLYASDSTAPSYFAGKVGIDNNAPSQLLHVGSASTASGAVATFQSADGSCSITPANNGSGIACSSDERLKENIEKVTGLYALDRLLKLQAVTYNFKTSSKENRKTGYLAQAVQKIAPEFVRENEDGYLQVYYDAFIPWITESIKTLYGRLLGTEKILEKHEREIASVKAENEKLKLENAAMKIRLEKIEKALRF